MRVLIIGATGSIGRLVVEQALDAGYEVTAFARNAHKLDFKNSNLNFINADATNQKSVNDAVLGQDAVIITLGSGKALKTSIRSTGTQKVINAMQKHGVQRLICQSTLGAHESWGNLNLLWKWIMFGIILKSVLKDHEKQETTVYQSKLNWTIVRPGAFSDIPSLGKYKEDFPATEKNLTLKISRAEVAGFLVRQLTETKYFKKAVSISY